MLARPKGRAEANWWLKPLDFRNDPKTWRTRVVRSDDAALIYGGSLHVWLIYLGVVAGERLRVLAGSAAGVQPAADPVNLVCDPATLLVAWERVKRNRGSQTAGVDGQTRKQTLEQAEPPFDREPPLHDISITIGHRMSCGEPDAQEWACPVRRAGRGNGPAVTPAPRPGSTQRRDAEVRVPELTLD